jgi:hypothetical protein
MISKLPRVLCGALVLLTNGCNLEHHAPLRTAELPPLAPSVLHANRLWIDVAEHVPENACVAPGHARLLCFEHFRTTLGSALTRSLWSSFPNVAVLGGKPALDGDYVLHVDLELEALAPDETRPGWSAGTRGTWRLERAGMMANQALAGEQVASRSRGDFAYGAPLGIGASEVSDAVAVRIGMALGGVPESRVIAPVPLPEVATAPLPPPALQPADLAKPAAGVQAKTLAF